MKQKAKKTELEKKNAIISPSRKPNSSYLILVFNFDQFIQVFGKVCKLVLSIFVLSRVREI